MPEIDLRNEKNRNIFLSWFLGKKAHQKSRRIGEGDLDNGEYVYADLIEGEPVNTYTAANSKSLLPDAFIKTHVSEKHGNELKAMGVIFDEEQRRFDVTNKTPTELAQIHKNL
jgi:hypothetical protein